MARKEGKGGPRQHSIMPFLSVSRMKIRDMARRGEGLSLRKWHFSSCLNTSWHINNLLSPLLKDISLVVKLILAHHLGKERWKSKMYECSCAKMVKTGITYLIIFKFDSAWNTWHLGRKCGNNGGSFGFM